MGVDFPAGFCYNAGKLSFYLSEALLLQYLTNLWNALDFGSLESILLRVASVFLCLTIHETCHGLAAYALGDPTAKRAHRLSLNPLRHIDWLGLIMMVAAGFGWAKPVPVDLHYFKKPKQGMALTALAGPVSNFLRALLLLLIARGEFLRAVTTGSFSGTWFSFLVDTASLSVGLGLFNLVCFPLYYHKPERVGLPFILASLAQAVYIVLMELAAHQVPFIRRYLDTLDPAYMPWKLAALGAGALLFGLMTLMGCRMAEKRFEQVDL